MSVSSPSMLETRRDQIFPVLAPLDIERMRRFGEIRWYADEEALSEVGKIGDGLLVFLSGKVEVTQRNASGQLTLIVTYGPGSFMGELAQLAGRPALSMPTHEARSRRWSSPRTSCGRC